jgi:ligand-binding sensor domain-containing protein
MAILKKVGEEHLKTRLKLLQWLFFWLSACHALVAMADGVPVAGTSAFASSSLVHEFPSTEPTFETLRDAGTIDNQAITALAQDGRGLIWIGTQIGLLRYDGYRFRKFSHKVGDPFSLAGDYVVSLYAAPDGRLWVGTVNDGISVFDPASERFEHFRHDEKVPGSLGGGSISALLGDGKGGMWIATGQGLNHLPAGSKRITHFRQGAAPHSLMSNKVGSLLRDNAGRLWVGTSNGLQRLAADGKSFETFLTGRDVRALLQAQDGKLWLGTKEHGAAWLDGSHQVHWLPLAKMSALWITEMVQMKTGQIWLASYGGGISIVAPEDGHLLQTLRHDPALPGSLVFDAIKPLLLDRAGWLWVGTWGAGLQRTNAGNTMLRNLKHSAKRPNGLSHPDISSVLELANGQWLIGTRGNGIDVFDRQRGVVNGYRPGTGQPGALPEANVHALAQTRDGSIWAGTEQAGVVRQLAGSTAWAAVPGLPDKQVPKLFASRDGSLWAGTIRGVARWQPGNPRARFETLLDELGNVMESGVNAIAEDGQGRVWIGTDNGLWLHEPGQRGLIRIPAEPNRPDGLASDFILGLLFDRHGSLWLATDKGLERLKSRDGRQARFEHVSALVGLPGSTMGDSLLQDRQGRIWTEKAVIEPATGPSGKPRISYITPADGMEIGTAWVGSYGQTRDGLLLFGGSHGLAVIDPAHFKAYDYAPPLVVTEMKINGQKVAPAMLANLPNQAGLGTTASTTSSTTASATDALTLEPTQRNFAIEFAALDYSEPKKNRYQYRLQGYDKDWINTDADHRSASYGNLWPGAYTLQVRGSNRTGEWSRHELSIPIRVLPAWWQTWWFALASLLMMTGLIALLIHLRTRYLQQRRHELEQLVNERTGQLSQKQSELLEANHELNQSNVALNEAIEALNESNTGLVLSVETLRQLGDIGREITTNLDADIVFQSLYLYVGGLLDAPTMTIYRMNAAATGLDAVFGRDADEEMPMNNVALDSPTSNAARAVRERRELMLHYDPQDDVTHIPGTRQMRTGLFAPLIVDDKVLGVMSIQSGRENAYGQRECMIFRTLTAYGAIALANAAAIAALRQAQGQLVQQEKMASLGGLVAGIAHEINTPLGTTLVAISGVENVWKTLHNAIESGRLSRSVLDSSTSEGMEYTALALKTARRAAELIALFKTIAVNADSDRSAEVKLLDYLEEVATLVRTQLLQNGCKTAANWRWPRPPA